MANYNKAFERVVKAEGGYVNDPDDKGGETYLGVSRRNHPDADMWEIIDDVKKINPGVSNAKMNKLLKGYHEIEEEVKAIYKYKYWNVIKGSEIDSQKLAEQLFDMAINAGPKNAINLMCKIIGDWPTSTATEGFIKAINNYGKRSVLRKI